MGICEMSAVDMAEKLRGKEISAREVLGAHLERIEVANPEINAVVTLAAERAWSEAHAADERLAHGQAVGPLHGLPMAHKDTHLTAGIRSTFGSPVLRDQVPQQDELLIDRLRRAGAVTIGKTNVPEFGAGSHTFNPLFGATRNPYDRTKSAGGSSGGAAAALAAGMHPLADGSDMGGSLRNPASFCNVVGLRPSPGRVPSHPTRAPWSGLGVQGPMARSVADTALLLSVMAGPDPRSPISLDEPGETFAQLPRHDVAGLRVAFSPDLGGAVAVDPAVTEVIKSQLGVFAGLGCDVDEACLDFSGAGEVFRTYRAWLFELSLGQLLDDHPGQFKAALAENIRLGRELTGPDLGRAAGLQAELFERARRFFDTYDALVLPVSQVPPFDVELEYPPEVAGVPSRSYLDWMASCCHVSATGHPALSVPAGFTADGLPVGLQIVGRHRGDLDVLRLGHAFEQARGDTTRRPYAVMPEDQEQPAAR